MLGTTVIAAGLTTALRAPGRDPRLLVGGLAALVAVSATAGVTDTTGISAGQVPLARSAWSDTGFWTAAPTGKPGAVTSYQAVACPTAQFCAALGTGLFGTLWSLSSDGGARWKPAERATQSLPLAGGPGAMGVVLIAGAPHGLSCWARSYYVASGSSPAQSTDSGKHWAHLRSKPGEDCPELYRRSRLLRPGPLPPARVRRRHGCSYFRPGYPQRRRAVGEGTTAAGGVVAGQRLLHRSKVLHRRRLYGARGKGRRAGQLRRWVVLASSPSPARCFVAVRGGLPGP